jgi:hypothetical protein
MESNEKFELTLMLSKYSDKAAMRRRASSNGVVGCKDGNSMLDMISDFILI